MPLAREQLRQLRDSTFATLAAVSDLVRFAVESSVADALSLPPLTPEAGADPAPAPAWTARQAQYVIARGLLANLYRAFVGLKPLVDADVCDSVIAALPQTTGHPGAVREASPVTWVAAVAADLDDLIREEPATMPLTEAGLSDGDLDALAWRWPNVAGNVACFGSRLLQHIDAVRVGAEQQFALLAQATMNSETVGEDRPAARKRSKKPLNTSSINARMLETIQRNHESYAWSQREWAERLGCEPSTVNDTPTWKTIMRVRRDNRQERSEDDRKQIGPK